MTAALLGGAGGHGDGMLQVNSLSGGSVNSWTAEDPYGACCAQLNIFNWVIQSRGYGWRVAWTRVGSGFVGH